MKPGNQVDDARERYLGELAPLLEAARPLDSLSPVQQRKVRRRIVRTLFGMRRISLRSRLLPALLAVLLVAIGGGAFATAQRLGVLPRFGAAQVERPASPTAPETRRLKGVRTRSAAPRPASVPAQPSPAVEEAARDVPPQAALDVAQARTPARQLVMATPRPARAGARPVARSASGYAEWGVPASRAVDPTVAPAPVFPAPKAMAYGASPPPAPAFSSPPSAPVAPMAPAAIPTAPLASPAGAVPAPPRPMPAAPAAPTVAPKPQVSDQALFGHALRKLRVDNQAAAALGSLREHAKAYPKSPFADERATLEVEALLALRREREALSLLDGMALETLPRSGERLVVRGELRAAARRWPEAARDFEQALARVSGSPAWHERALWGRAVSRLRMGEREAGLADVEAYVDTYPKGRFAADAARFFPR